MRTFFFTLALTALTVVVEANRPIRRRASPLEIGANHFQHRRHHEVRRSRCHASFNSSSSSTATSISSIPSPSPAELTAQKSGTHDVKIAASVGVTISSGHHSKSTSMVKTQTKNHTSAIPPSSLSPFKSGSGSGSPASGSSFDSTLAELEKGISGEGGTGDMTFYDPGLGACGITNSADDMICAADLDLFDSFGGGYPDGNPNTAPICGKKISITAPGATKSITLTIVDRCAGCTKFGSMDLSPAAFNQLADPSVGRVPGMTWFWVQ